MIFIPTQSVGIDEYIVDFFCPKLNLVIEIDGESHSGKAEFDVQQNIEGVLLTIKEWIKQHEEKGNK